MKCHKIISAIAVAGLLSILCTQLYAQQSRVDSIVQLLNISFINNKPDTASFDAARELIFNSSLTEEQVVQIETAAAGYKSQENFTIRVEIFSSILKTDINKAINYGKLQIEKIDELALPELSNIRVRFLGNLRIPFRNTTRIEDGFSYFTQKLNFYKTRNDSSGISLCYFVLAGFYNTTGLTDLAIYNMKKSISYLDTSRQKGTWINNTSGIAAYYSKKGDKNESLKYYRLVLNEKTRTPLQNFTSTVGMANVFIEANQLDSAVHYINLVKRDTTPYFDAFRANFLQIESLYNIHAGNLEEAENLLNKCWQLVRENNIPADAPSGIIAPDYYLALIRIKQNRLDEAITLLTRDIERLLNNNIEKLRDYRMLADLYNKTGKNDKAAETYSTFITLQDMLLTAQDKYRSFSFEAEQLISEKELSIAKLESENKISSLTKNFSIGLAVLLLVIAAGFYKGFRTKKKANLVLENTLTELKSTQSQLIQSEKMASLGELTAGIAHEIQNPLNFVNNFSELNNELITEMNIEIEKCNTDEVKAIATDIKQNLEKINHHGKRADSIVKGMLQHSQKGSGQKEPTDLNAMAEEYLRLSYHGTLAKDITLNASFVTDLDKSIGNVALVQQDISRVLLNLYNNAFYAVAERQKKETGDYQPTVTTKRKDAFIEISVKDNGNGIPESIKDKIFQPFFTTKPTGQGTGLGLSLSYDIVKAQGGELKVESKEGEGSEFVVQLPSRIEGI